MPLREFLQRFSSREITELIAFVSEEPMGEWRSDIHHARLLATVAEIHRDAKRRPTPYRFDEMLLGELLHPTVVPGSPAYFLRQFEAATGSKCPF